MSQRCDVINGLGHAYSRVTSPVLCFPSLFSALKALPPQSHIIKEHHSHHTKSR